MFRAIEQRPGHELLIFEKSMSHRDFGFALILGFSRQKTKTFGFQSSVEIMTRVGFERIFLLVADILGLTR